MFSVQETDVLVFHGSLLLKVKRFTLSILHCLPFKFDYSVILFYVSQVRQNERVHYNRLGSRVNTKVCHTNTGWEAFCLEVSNIRLCAQKVFCQKSIYSHCHKQACQTSTEPEAFCSEVFKRMTMCPKDFCQEYLLVTRLVEPKWSRGLFL